MNGLAVFTLAHVVISLVGILSGIVVLWGLLGGRRLDGWTLAFLVSTVATSVTGFGFPFTQFLPSHAVGVLSLLVLTIAIIARYAMQLDGWWRPIYVMAAVTALYFNVFVLIVQFFQKTPALHALAPTQTEPPFLIAQGAALLVFLWLGFHATVRFSARKSTTIVA